MSVSLRSDPVDRLITSCNALIAEAEATITLIEAGNQFQRNNIVDITAETLATATRTRDTLREGLQLLLQVEGR